MEFIENAKGFYNGITFLKRALLDARVEKDEKKEKEMISEMESYLFHLKQFLGTIMERKGNIVDLGEVWHWYKDEKPRNVDDLCVFVVDGIPIADVNNMISLERFVDSCFVNEIKAHSIRWAYIEDLLPKVDNK